MERNTTVTRSRAPKTELNGSGEMELLDDDTTSIKEARNHNEERKLKSYLLKIAPSVLEEVKQIADDKGTTTLAVLRDLLTWGLFLYKARRRSPDAQLLLVEGETVRELVIL